MAARINAITVGRLIDSRAANVIGPEACWLLTILSLWTPPSDAALAEACGLPSVAELNRVRQHAIDGGYLPPLGQQKIS